MRFVEDVSQETISMLQRIYKQSKHHRVRQRAQCLLLSYHGSTTTQLMKIFQVDRITIYHWFNAWETRHLPGLYDKAKQGRPQKCTPEQKASIRIWQRTTPVKVWVNAILTGSLRACSPQDKCKLPSLNFSRFVELDSEVFLG